MAESLVLTVDSIGEHIDEACRTAFKNGNCDGWSFRRLSADDSSAAIPKSSLLFGVQATKGADSCIATFYLAYSTWDGRFLYLDECKDNTKNDLQRSMVVVVRFYQLLANIAVRLNCSRFTWQHTAENTIQFPNHLQPESCKGWLTLHWKRDSMYSYLGKEPDHFESSSKEDTTEVRKDMESCLSKQAHGKFRLRLANATDVKSIGLLVQGLAEYEKEPDAVNVSIDQYRSDGFGELPLFYCLLLEDASDPVSKPCGMAFCYLGRKLNEGRFLYLEDLFIDENFRRQGAGSCLMRALASIALSLHCSRLVWQALDWNTPALNFYNNIGAAVMYGLLTTRWTGSDLNLFSSSHQQEK